MFTTSISLATLAAGSFHCATMCRREKKQIVIFTAGIKETEGRVAAGVKLKGKISDGREGLKEKKSLLINVGFEAPLLLDPPAWWLLPRGREER